MLSVLRDKGLVSLGREEGIPGKRIYNGDLLFNGYRVVWCDEKNSEIGWW